MTPEGHRERFEQQLRRNSGLIPEAPTGPLLDTFNALELAQAIESEINRAPGSDYRKIRLDMHFTDAQALASFLRRAVNKGA